MSTWIFGGMVAVGLVVGWWTCWLNPNFGGPDDPSGKWVTTGPYRFLKHPMYVCNWLIVTGCAGLAAGWWNAAAIGGVAQLLMTEWVKRENKHTAAIRRRHDKR